MGERQKDFQSKLQYLGKTFFFEAAFSFDPNLSFVA
jgi:hypothetical protein